MRRKTIGFFILFLFLTAGSVVPTFASSVTYRNQAELFVFVPNSKDLFENFKGLMPGDLRTQEIFLRNDSAQLVDFYLKINPATEEDRALLREMTLVITEEGEEIFRETLDQQGAFDDYVRIAELLPESEFSWNLSLEVSRDMGNEFMGREAEVEWVIMIEELEEEDIDPLPLPEDPELPKTGEAKDNMLLYGGLTLILGIVLFQRTSTNKTSENYQPK